MLTLASDFGSPYPAAMRAAILRRTDARIVDVAHDFPRQDVRAAAFWLREVLPYVPPAVHCAVIDPGVGSDRAAIAVRVGDHALVGPDSGLLLPAARALQEPAPVAGAGLRGVEAPVDRGVDSPVAGEADATADAAAATAADTAVTAEAADDRPPIDVFEIVVDDPESSTFHGRDVFAPAAAEIHEAGVDAIDDCPFLEPTADYVDLTFPAPELREDGATGTILVVDGFGNAITNVPGSVLDDCDSIRVDGESAPVCDHYAAVGPDERLVTVGSHGNVEFAVNRGRGSDAFDVAASDRVELRFD